MKVCMLTTNHPPDDPRIYELETKSLCENGFEVVVIAKPPAYPAWFRFTPGKTDPLSHLSEGLRYNEPDVVHCHDPWALMVGMGYTEDNPGTKLVYDCHEHTPSRYCNPKRPNRLIWGFEKKALGFCDAVFTANHIVRGYLLTQNPGVNVEVLYNCPHIGGPFVYDKYEEGVFRIVYEGGRGGMARGVDVLRRVADRLDAELTLLQDKPYSELPRWEAQHHVGVIPYQPVPNNMLAGPPHKLFSYMAAGIPIVSTPLPESTRILRRTGAGIVTEGFSEEDLFRALEAVKDHPDFAEHTGDKGYQAHLNRWNWEEEERTLLDVYSEIEEE